ncbi:MAG: recombination mediator RecR [Planctomycetota bacterium]
MPAPPADAYQRLIDALTTLAGIGPRSAQRIAFDLLKRPADHTDDLIDALRRFRHDLRACSICGYVSDADPCRFCTDPKRDPHTVLVVEQPTDALTIDQTGAFRGRYHVLLGRLSPLDAIGPGDLNLDPLLARLDNEPINEIVLGLSPTLEGDGTALYLTDALTQRKPALSVSRLARGLPNGANLNTLSKAVLADAIHGRR